MEAVQRSDNERRLREIAEHDNDPEIRLAAVGQITRNELLAELALDASDRHVGRAAIAQISEPESLEVVARRSTVYELCVAALERINDPAVLVRLATESGPIESARGTVPLDPDFAIRAIQRIEDPEVLRSIIFGNEPIYWAPFQRQAALEKLAEPETLTRVAREHHDPEVRLFAVERVIDDVALQTIALEDGDARVQRAAIGRLGPALLAEVATSHPNWGMQILALERIEDQALLARIVQRDGPWIVRRQALRRLNESAPLTKIALAIDDITLAREVVERISDLSQLQLIARNAAHWNARRAAVDLLIDQDELTAIAMEDPHVAVRLAAIEKIDRPDLFETIVRNSNRDDVILAACERLENQSLLLETALADASGIIGAAAAASIRDISLLEQVAADAAHPLTRIEAYYGLIPALPVNDPRLREIVAIRGAGPYRGKTNALNRAALARITGEEFLMEVVIDSGRSFPNLATDAINRMRNLDNVFAIVSAESSGSDNPYVWTRPEAVQRWLALAGPDQIKEAALGNVHENLRLGAIERTDDQAILRLVALTEPGTSAGQAAISRLDDTKMLRSLIVSHPDEPGLNRIAADRLLEIGSIEEIASVAQQIKSDYQRDDFVARLQDQQTLKSIATEDPSFLAQVAAIRNIRDDSFLLQLALNSPDSAKRKAAIDSLQTSEALTEFTKRSTNNEERIAAIKRMTDSEVLQQMRENSYWAHPAESATDPNEAAIKQPVDDSLSDAERSALLALERARRNAPRMEFSRLTRAASDRLRELRVAELRDTEDQQLLQDALTNERDDELKLIAAERLDDQQTISAIAASATRSDLRLKALGLVADPMFPIDRLGSDSSTEVRLAAIDRVDDEEALKRAARTDTSPEVRMAAFRKIADEDFKRNTALTFLRSDDRLNAARIMRDTLLVESIALTERAASARLKAAETITDEDILFEISQRDPSASVRAFALNSLKSPKLLALAALVSDAKASRDLARDGIELLNDAVVLGASKIERYRNRTNQLGSRDRERVAANADRLERALSVATKAGLGVMEMNALARRVALADFQVASRLAEISKDLNGTDNGPELVQAALDSEFDVLRLAAIERITAEPDALEVAMHSRDRAVVRAALEKIASTDLLNDLAANAVNRPTSHAASIKAGATTWAELFEQAAGDGLPSSEVGAILAAVALLPKNEAVQPFVTQTCLRLIREGDESRIPELSELLMDYGDKPLAEDYMNCGQPDLDVAGRAWAAENGYSVSKGPGSARARWGGP